MFRPCCPTGLHLPAYPPRGSATVLGGSRCARVRTIVRTALRQPLSTGMVVLHDPVGSSAGIARSASRVSDTQVDSIAAVVRVVGGRVGWMLDCLDGAGAGFHDIPQARSLVRWRAFGGLELRGSSCLSKSASWTGGESILGNIRGGRMPCARRHRFPTPVPRRVWCW